MERRGMPTLVQSTRAHRGEVTCLDLSPDGARLATGGRDRALRVWSWCAAEGWAPEAEAERAHRYGVTAARWSPGGALLASGGVDGCVRAWAAETGEAETRLACRRLLGAPGAGSVRALCWAGGGAGARLAVGHDDGVACLWAVRRGALLARLAAHEGALHALCVTRGALLLTACTEGTLKVFDLNEVRRGLEEGAASAALTWVDGAHDMGVLCAEAARDGRAVATGGRDARVRLWRTEGRALVAAGALVGHAAAVTALRWGEGVLASASLDRSARLWAPAEGACLHAVLAHARYLTSVALAPDLRYMITGSNDESFRTWTLGAFSLEDELRTPCDALEHFAVGDLEGIGPVEDDDDATDGAGGAGTAASEGDGSDRGGPRCVWSARAHDGAINCIAAYGQFIATASSDGTVKVWRWMDGAKGAEGVEGVCEEHVLAAHRYPALAVDFGAAGSVLLSAGLDGAAYLWDVRTGVQVRSLCVQGGGRAEGGAEGGGGVRGARLSAQRPPRALLATDDGLVPLFTTADGDPLPKRVYGGHAEAATCCAWAGDARLCAVGGAGGELRLLAPPEPDALHHRAHAHDLGVTSCDFAPSASSSALCLPEGSYMLATAGNDSLIKLWTIELYEGSLGPREVRVLLSRSVKAHGGSVSSVRWCVGRERVETEDEEGAVLGSAGDDRWARAWRVTNAEGEVRVEGYGAAACTASAGGALCALPLRRGGREMLAVGALRGELALWRLEGRSAAARAEEDAADPRLWREAAVVRWLERYVSRVPECGLSREEEATLVGRVRAERVSGARLLDTPLDDLLACLGYGTTHESAEEDLSDSEAARARTRTAHVRARLRDELEWLRADSPPVHWSRGAPHALLCPLSHALLRWPTRAADGYTYERDNIQEWLLAEGAVSPVSGRRLRDARLAPNYKLMATLRAFLRERSTRTEQQSDHCDSHT